ncbi:hypothetical protein KAJ83_04475 [Marivibrio halodurans]|uniref:Uncharacterized protein n=1 Tax=Marivibrio halodurans TaxID=2039722 RepID=A0A8J7SH91_9PROT|nr:hypothetical protein [Marivibrio halodurans]MBP5856253.1 hypothetical protein [Marivibrio halodurans]
MTNNVENIREIKEIHVESSYDSFYRYSLWQFICQDAWALGDGRRAYFNHVIRHVESPRYKIIDPLSLKPINTDNLKEADIANFVGKRHGAGPGMHTTVAKLNVLDAYAKIRAPDTAQGFRIDRAQYVYADFKAKRIIKKLSSYILSEIDFFFSENDGIYYREDRPNPTKVLFLKHLPKKPYAIVHVLILNDAEYPLTEGGVMKENVPDFQRYSGIIIPDLSGHCAIELQNAYHGRIETMEAFFIAGQRVSFDVVRPRTLVKSESAAKPTTILLEGHRTTLSGEYKSMPKDHKYYIMSDRLFAHFGERI